MDTGDIIRWKKYLAVVGIRETEHLVNIIVLSNTTRIEDELAQGKPSCVPAWVQVTVAVDEPDVEVLL